MLRFAPSIEYAKLSAKKDFDLTCVRCGGQQSVDGAHLFSASQYPALRCCIENIYPLCRKCHSTRGIDCLDITSGGVTRQPRGRLVFMITRMHPDHSQNVRKRLKTLFEGIVEEGINDISLHAMMPDMLDIMEEL